MSTIGSVHVLRFAVAESIYAVAIARVVEIASRVAIAPLPGAPSFVEGVFSYRRSACVTISLRRRFGHPARRPALDEHIVVVRGRRRLLGLIVDRALGDDVIADAAIEPSDTSPLVPGVVPREDGVILIHDVDALLTDAEERSVDESLNAG